MLLNVRPEIGRALVVGAGTIGRRKIATLQRHGFQIRVADPELDLAWAECEGLEGIRADFDPGQLRGVALVFACTNQRSINAWIGGEAQERGLPVLVADAPEESTFFSVASFEHDGLEIGVSSQGRDPARAKAERDALRQRYAAE